MIGTTYRFKKLNFNTNRTINKMEVGKEYLCVKLENFRINGDCGTTGFFLEVVDGVVVEHTLYEAYTNWWLTEASFKDAVITGTFEIETKTIYTRKTIVARMPEYTSKMFSNYIPGVYPVKS